MIVSPACSTLSTSIDEVNKFVEDKYASALIGLPIKSLPDHHLFELLLNGGRLWFSRN